MTKFPWMFENMMKHLKTFSVHPKTLFEYPNALSDFRDPLLSSGKRYLDL